MNAEGTVKFATLGMARGTERDMNKVWTFLMKSFELETQKNCSLSNLPLFSLVTKLPLSHSVHNLAKQSTGMLASEAMRKESGLVEHMYAALLPARLASPISNLSAKYVHSSLQGTTDKMRCTTSILRIFETDSTRLLATP